MKGILFKELMFKATIKDLKTQTRRIIKEPKWAEPGTLEISEEGLPMAISKRSGCLSQIKPRYKKGETVYLKEPYMFTPNPEVINPNGNGIRYKFSESKQFIEEWKWQNKLFMPTKYARYFIKITDVRIEQIRDITEQEAINEGVGYGFQMNAVYPDYMNIKNGICTLTQDSVVMSFATLWESINGKDSWNNNPCVFVYEYELTSNIKTPTQ